MPKLIITRSRELVNMSSDYVIYVNGKKKARLANGKDVKLKLKPGKHKLKARVEDYQSQTLNISLEKGESKELKIKSFRFNNWILPAIVILIPGFHFLHNEWNVSLLVALVFVIPVLAYALYFHTKGKARYLRWVKVRSGESNQMPEKVKFSD